MLYFITASFILKIQSVGLLNECILLRDSVLTLPDIFTVTNIEHNITELCSVS